MNGPTKDEVAAMVAGNRRYADAQIGILQGWRSQMKASADMLEAVAAENATMRAAKWDVQHTDTMNDFVSICMDRDDLRAQLAASEAARMADERAAAEKALKDALTYIDKGHHGMARNIIIAALARLKGE